MSTPPLALDKPTLGKLRYTHDEMINVLIARPEVSQNELALIFGYSVGWMSIIINSDAFKARLAERRGELVDPMILSSVKDRLEGVASLSLAVLAEKLAMPAHQVPDQLALQAAQISTKAMGYGAKVESTPAPVAADRLDKLADRLTCLLHTKRVEVVDGEIS